LADIEAKHDAGYDTTIIDAWGRLLSYQLLYGSDGGVSVRLSGLTSLSNFTSHNVPYPIITTTTDFPDKGQCYPTLDSPIFEFHPYEYGSWDSGISAFASTKFMGTNMNRGKPVDTSNCTKRYDNIGYIFGTSSDVFNGECGTITPSNNTADLPGVLEAIIAQIHPPAVDDEFGKILLGIIPMPTVWRSRSARH
jgi:lysophospholipase